MQTMRLQSTHLASLVGVGSLGERHAAERYLSPPTHTDAHIHARTPTHTCTPVCTHTPHTCTRAHTLYTHPHTHLVVVRLVTEHFRGHVATCKKDSTTLLARVRSCFRCNATC